MRIQASFVFFLTLITLMSCNQSKQNNLSQSDYYPIEALSSHGNYFDFLSNGTDTAVYLYANSDRTDTTVLSKNDQRKTLAILAAPHAAFFGEVNSMPQVKAFSNKNYLYHQTLIDQIESGYTAEIGFEASLDKEKLVLAGIEQVIISGGGIANTQQYDVIEDAGITVIAFNDWLEPTALDRSAWILVAGFLSGNMQKAYQQFQDTKSNYELLKKKSETNSSATVIVNAPYKGIWYMPGGESYMTSLIEDAGGTFPWASNNKSGAQVIDFEAIYIEGLKADVWLNPGMHRKINDLVSLEERVTDWPLVKSGQIYNSTKRINSYGGNDYFEMGAVRADLLLEDISNIFRGQLDSLYFFEPLQ